MLIIGHRGASADAPENTLVAFEQALNDGADGVEFDVQLASDGVPVIIHDAHLNRTALRQGSVSSLPSAELKRIQVGEWFNRRFPSRSREEYSGATIPSLEEAFEFFATRTGTLYIEMKCRVRESEKLAGSVVDLVRRFKFRDRAVVLSFMLSSIKEIKNLDSGIRTAALFEPKLSRPIRSKRSLIDNAKAHEADEIALHRSLATKRTLRFAKESGLKTVVWTANHLSWIQRASANGIDAVITNVPRKMVEERTRLKSMSSDTT